MGIKGKLSDFEAMGFKIGPAVNIPGVSVPKAVGRAPRKPGQMNETEAEYWGELQVRRAGGEVLWCAYEPMKFRIGDRCWWTPDFGVMLADLSLEFVDVKGHVEDDAVVKLRAVRTLYPMFAFRAVKRQSGRFVEILTAIGDSSLQRCKED